MTLFPRKTHFLYFLTAVIKLKWRLPQWFWRHSKRIDVDDIPIGNWHGKGYDNATKISGKCNGSQIHIRSINSLSLCDPCVCHSLNLCETNSAMSCKQAVIFLGTVQIVYNIFSCSPQLWNIGYSLHGLSETRWTDRVASVRPFSAQLPNIIVALQQIIPLNLTPMITTDIDSASR